RGRGEEKNPRGRIGGTTPARPPVPEGRGTGETIRNGPAVAPEVAIPTARPRLSSNSRATPVDTTCAPTAPKPIADTRLNPTTKLGCELLNPTITAPRPTPTRPIVSTDRGPFRRPADRQQARRRP